MHDLDLRMQQKLQSKWLFCKGQKIRPHLMTILIRRQKSCTNLMKAKIMRTKNVAARMISVLSSKPRPKGPPRLSRPSRPSKLLVRSLSERSSRLNMASPAKSSPVWRASRLWKHLERKKCTLNFETWKFNARALLWMNWAVLPESFHGISGKMVQNFWNFGHFLAKFRAFSGSFWHKFFHFCPTLTFLLLFYVSIFQKT